MPGQFTNPPADPSSLPDAKRRPLLVYDGDCGFCNYWIRYWRALTGDAVEYAPYQEVAAQYPQIPPENFPGAIQYIAPDGTIASAAQASFLVLKHAPGKRLWWALYTGFPGFAYASERAYAFVAGHREAFYHISRFLWGRSLEPVRYEFVSWLFLRLFGLIYLSAFLSFAVQAQGLIGSHGILPLADLTHTLSLRSGAERYWLLPMVFWFNSSDFAIQAVCWTGAGLSLLVTFNILPRASLFLLYVLYLSLVHAGQEFMQFQWDSFLLETGFSALILSFSTGLGIWLLRWLLFRFMFMSGVVKLLSGDPNWWGLSALSYHFLTQPLPTPLAWYAAHLPAVVLKFATGATFFVELVLPFFIFCPRRLRFFAAYGILSLEFLIFLTGNYNWFNLQTMLLCLPLFDDRAMEWALPARLGARLHPPTRAAPPGRFVSSLAGVFALLIVFCGLVEMEVTFGDNPPALASAVAEAIEPLQIVSAYGLFANMTTRRNEIVIEGSDDGLNWREYEFRYKPGNLERVPRWIIPHQPRLDWQMWFAALESPQQLPWFGKFLERVLQNQPDVVGLLENNPFPDHPPTYVRAQFYEYVYAGSDGPRNAAWWKRRSLGLYFPQVSLKNTGG